MNYTPPTPKPDGLTRRLRSYFRRRKASEASQNQLHTSHNGESAEYAPTWPTNFSKGLPHDANGTVSEEAFKTFFEAINAEDDIEKPEVSEFHVPLGPIDEPGSYRIDQIDVSGGVVKKFFSSDSTDKKVRGWESPRSGHIYDLEGPDAGSVGMAPAPRLGSDELAAEMAENYAMALLRDVTFEDIRKGTGTGYQNVTVSDTTDALNSLRWFNGNEQPVYIDFSGDDPNQNSSVSERRRFARWPNGQTSIDSTALFRGSSPGCMAGPYISQFLLSGTAPLNANQEQSKGYQVQTKQKRTIESPDGSSTTADNTPKDGYIVYGAQRIDQRVNSTAGAAEHGQPEKDYLTDWATWLDVQNGADLRGGDLFGKLRFITTPRDLATYVHYDALYQAYLNACLFLLAAGAKTDAGMPEGNPNRIPPTRTAFASFGGPHVLTLVTEGATRALKAVRRQKFNHHLRARPEALGAVATIADGMASACLGPAEVNGKIFVDSLKEALLGSSGKSILTAINDHNQHQNQLFSRTSSVSGAPNIDGCNYLLPMAFPEGSPMHASYGAGHATVAGACVTMLKAFFEMFDTENDPDSWDEITLNDIKDSDGNSVIAEILVPTPDGQLLEPSSDFTPSNLTLSGELNKLAANISIGRNMAGVHFYSDYFDSLRMGERIAVGMLEEQMMTYPEPVRMRFKGFDNDRVTIETNGQPDGTKVTITNESGQIVEDWWGRFIPTNINS